MKFPITSIDVDREIRRIRRRYNREKPGLGEDFFDNVNARIAFVCEYSNSGSIAGKEIRRIKVTRFPYHLYYRIESDVIWIVAIIHNRQDR